MQDITIGSTSRLRSPQIMLIGSGAAGGPDSIGLAKWYQQNGKGCRGYGRDLFLDAGV